MSDQVCVIQMHQVYFHTLYIRRIERSKKNQLFPILTMMIQLLINLHFRMCINIYEFMNSQWVIYCVANLNTAWSLPAWGRYTNEVSSNVSLYHFTLLLSHQSNLDQQCPAHHQFVCEFCLLLYGWSSYS